MAVDMVLSEAACTLQVTCILIPLQVMCTLCFFVFFFAFGMTGKQKSI